MLQLANATSGSQAAPTYTCPDVKRSRGRRDGIAGDEASSFLFNDDEEKWRMLQQLVHGVPELCAEVECLRTLESASRSITPLPRHTAAVEPHAGVDGAHAAGGGAAGVRPAAGLRCSTPPLLGHSCRPGGLAAVAEERALSGGLAPDGPAPADGGGPAVPGSREPTASQHDFTLPFSHEELMYGNTRQCVLSTYNVPHDLMVMGTGTQIMNSLLGIHDAQESNSGPLAGLRGEPQPGALVTEVRQGMVQAGWVLLHGRCVRHLLAAVSHAWHLQDHVKGWFSRMLVGCATCPSGWYHRQCCAW